jgi:topoisomerase-4 subunit A
VFLIQKFDPAQVISAIYQDGKSKVHYVKRFQIETTTLDKKFIFISEEKGSKLFMASTAEKVPITFFTEDKKKNKNEWELDVEDFIEVRGWKSVGNRLSPEDVKKVKMNGPKVGEPIKKIPQNIVEQFAEENGDGRTKKTQLDLL